jgi:hypothetical protein
VNAIAGSTSFIDIEIVSNKIALSASMAVRSLMPVTTERLPKSLYFFAPSPYRGFGTTGL